MLLPSSAAGKQYTAGLGSLCGCKGMGCAPCGMGDTLSDYTAGLMATATPSSWGTVFATGNLAGISGLLTVPVLAVLALSTLGGGGGGRRRR